MDKAAQMTLADLPPNRRGVIKSLNAEGMIRRRLLDLGLTPGTVVETVRRSPAGDPVAFKIRGAAIALRQEDGRRVYIQQL
jgi:ferrous iron transport protein A